MDLFTIATGTILIILLILIPGISLSLALFPKKEELDPVERIGVSFVLGLTPQFLLYFGDKNLFVSTTTLTTAGTILLVTLIGLAIWRLRLKR